jgi:hypothetical protein
VEALNGAMEAHPGPLFGCSEGQWLQPFFDEEPDPVLQQSEEPDPDLQQSEEPDPDLQQSEEPDPSYKNFNIFFKKYSPKNTVVSDYLFLILKLTL